MPHLSYLLHGRLFSMPPSINKQFPLSCFLRQLYIHLEPFHSLSSVGYISHIHFSQLIIPSRPTPCPTSRMSCTPNNSPLRVYHHALNCHTCYFSLFFFCAFFCYLPLRLSDGYAILSQSMCAVQNIKSECPARHSFLDRICLSQSCQHPQCCRLFWLSSPCPSQPIDCVANSCLMMAEWQLHFAKCSHLCNPKAYPLGHYSLKDSPSLICVSSALITRWLA